MTEPNGFPDDDDRETGEEDEAALRERFSARYRVVGADVIREIERRVFDTDYGVTSWTTRLQAIDFAGHLAVGPGDWLLDLGSGAGWPGLFLADTTGCQVTLTDVPIEGLVVAQGRAAIDGLAQRCTSVSAAGEALPFREGVFDAISHSDVLC